ERGAHGAARRAASVPPAAGVETIPGHVQVLARSRTPLHAVANCSPGDSGISRRHGPCSRSGHPPAERHIRRMTLRDWPEIVACVIGLSLVLLVIWRGRRSPLAAPLALLVLNLTAWNFADDAWHASGETVLLWHLLDHTLSPLTIPLALGFALMFVGRYRQLRWLLGLSWALAVLTAAPSLLGLLE